VQPFKPSGFEGLFYFKEKNMLNSKFRWYIALKIAVGLVLIHSSGVAYDITDKFSIGGVLSGAYQYQSGDDIDDKGRGTLPFQPEMSFRPSGQDEIFAKFGFATGNGLNGTTEFNLAPWAADLEDDVEDINGRSRDYLLTVWYKHTFAFSDHNALGLTGGIIDSTDYIDENAYANDEYTQFMNEALVNAPIGFAPSYDGGAAIEWQLGSWAFKGVGMNVGENDDGKNYNFFAAQVGYTLNTSLGEGNYRVIGQMTSEDFADEDGDTESLMAAILSFDQALGDVFGAWIRCGWQDDDALINYEYLVSGGLNITGQWYGRGDDNIGIGFAYLNGADDGDFDYTRVAEVYWRFVLNEYFAATADFQYMADEFNTDEEDIDGFILGIRGTVEF
jgi:porin